MKQNLEHVLGEYDIMMSSEYRTHIFSQIIKEYDSIIINWSLDFIFDSPLFVYNQIKHTNKYNNLVTYYGQFYTTHGLVNIYMDSSNYLDMNEFECTNDINDLISKIKNKLRKEKFNRLINEKPIEETIEKKETIIKKKKSLIKRIISKLKF